MKLGEIARKPIIYLDMDGVLANFNKAVKKHTGKEPKDLSNDELWQSLKDFSDIYADLEKLDDAEHLFDEVKKLAKSHGYDVKILTAVPRSITVPSAHEDKNNWIKRHFGNYEVKIGPFSRDKWNHAREGDILIDDRKSNIKDWTKKGGQFAILHTNAKDSLATLRHHLANKS